MDFLVFIQQLPDPSHQYWILFLDGWWKHSCSAKRQQAYHRTNLDGIGFSIGKAKYVVEEFILLVPHIAFTLLTCGHCTSNAAKMPNTLFRHFFIGTIMFCKFESNQ